jgi:hypothetical protein
MADGIRGRAGGWLRAIANRTACFLGKFLDDLHHGLIAGWEKIWYG